MSVLNSHAPANHTDELINEIEYLKKQKELIEAQQALNAAKQNEKQQQAVEPLKNNTALLDSKLAELQAQKKLVSESLPAPIESGTEESGKVTFDEENRYLGSVAANLGTLDVAHQITEIIAPNGSADMPDKCKPNVLIIENIDIALHDFY